jgi:hypothetical protein
MTQEQQHSITPPPELVEQLRSSIGTWLHKITIAYQAGADQELEACCDWVKATLELPGCANQLRLARRPKPLSAVAQAETLIERHEDGWVPSPAQWHTIREGLAEGRRAVEALPND